MEVLKRISEVLLPTTPADAVSIGVIDFKAKTFDAVDVFREGEGESPYYDLASLTKPLTNSLGYFLKPSNFSPDMLLCLSHRGGLPSWGLLPKEGWRELIQAFPVREAETLYSDFSPLRVLLEFNKKDDLKKTCQSIWDSEVMNWLDLPVGVPLLQYGFKESAPNFGAVHDPNAYTLGTFCSHAGLFGTIRGVCRTLLKYQEQTDFVTKVKKDLSSHKHRFAFGWDRVENPETTLAGKGCGPSTFGHLGFTGTSIWIDPDKQLGHVILSNATKLHWFDKQGLNDLRRAIGEKVWSGHL